MKLTDGEKLIVLMLSEVHEKLGIKDGIDSKFVREALYSGNAWAINHRYSGILREQTGDDVVSEVFDILQLWFHLEEAYTRRKARRRCTDGAEPPAVSALTRNDLSHHAFSTLRNNVPHSGPRCRGYFRSSPIGAAVFVPGRRAITRHINSA
jgi:hypothetical protein